MLKKRLIACLLLRDGLIIQSFGFQRHLPIGRARFSIEFLVKWDVDEIVLLDISASGQGRSTDSAVLEALSEHCYVPLTVGGGIRNVKDVRSVIRAGADKVCVNTHAVARPPMITEIADSFGSQCVVVSMDCLKQLDGTYRVCTESGKKITDLRPEEWARKCESLGAGEIFVNSIDRDGSRLGYDIDLIKSITQAVKIPVIACGGVGRFSHFSEGILEAGAQAVAAANIFQHTEHSTILAKSHMLKAGIDVRLDSPATYGGRDFDESGRLIMLHGEHLMNM
jgi:imidazole glycerol-phosphate synthase subunit HisF